MKWFDIPKLPSAQTKQYHSSFLFQSIKDYENIPLEIRDSRTLFTFILKMKKKLFSFWLDCPRTWPHWTHIICMSSVLPFHTLIFCFTILIMITVTHLYPHLITLSVICANTQTTCRNPRGNVPYHYMCKQTETIVMVYTNNANRRYVDHA